MSTAPYRISYTQGPDGKVSIAVDINGPLPDPFAGLSGSERRELMAKRLSFGEYVTLWSVRKLPAAARQVVWIELLARRRQRHDRSVEERIKVATQLRAEDKARVEAKYAPRPPAVVDQEPEPQM